MPAHSARAWAWKELRSCNGQEVVVVVVERWWWQQVVRMRSLVLASWSMDGRQVVR